MINTLKLNAREKLQYLVLTLQDDLTINHINKEIVFFLMFAQRLDILFPSNIFADNAYYDQKLIFLKDIIGWANIQTQLEIINIQLISDIFLYFIGIIHWIVCILCIYINNKTNFINLIIRKYFTYFQPLLLVPSFLHLNKYLIHDTIVSVIILIPITFNTIVLLFIQRNYSIPVINPFNKRYNLFNNLIALSDLICLLTLATTTEYYQTYIILAWYFLQYIDAYLFSPYSYYENLLYVQSSSVLFACGVIKLISFYMDQQNTIYFILLISPLLSFISIQVLDKIIFSIIYQDKLTLKQIILITDIQYSKQTPTLAILMILKNIKSNYQIEISKKESIYFSTQNLIINLFDRLISSKPINQRYSDESLFLYKSLFLIKTCQRQSLGYISLKKYAANTHKQGFFFKIYSEILQQIIQNVSSKQIKQTDTSENLQLYDIRQSEILYESSVQLLNSIIDTKIQFWVNLLKGYTVIEDLADSVMNLSEQIWEMQGKIFRKLNLSPQTVSKQLFSLNSLQLKLISFIYSVVLNDYHVTLEIETRIEELMSMERNLNTDLIKNTTLLMDEVIMISTSVIKCRGQILNKNRSSLALFFGYENDKDFSSIQYIEQLMPKFTAEIHESCFNNYMSSGCSILFDSSKEVFYQQKSKYISCSNIQLVHIYENVDDYIITGALQKIKQSLDFIIFDQLGRVVGITKNIFKTLVEQDENEVLVEQIIGKSFIYFWFNQIYEIINDEQKDIFDEDQQNAKLIQKSQLIMPLKNISKTISENASYRKIHNWNISLQESKQSKLQDSLEPYTIGSQDEEKVQFGIHLLKQSFRDKAKQFIQDINQNGLVPYLIKYTIQLRLLTPLKVPFFVLQISEITRKSQRPGQTFITSANYSSIWSNKKQSVITNKDYDDLCIAESNEDNENIKINQTVINKLGNIVNEDQEFKEIEKSCDVNYIISPRGNKDKLIQKNQDMQDQIEEDEEQKELDEIQLQSSSQKQKKQDVREILQQNKEDKFENDQEFNKSKTSATSDKTQNSIFNLLKHLQYSQKYQTTIVKAIINTILLFITLTILILSHLMLLRSNITELQAQIPLVRIPDRFNRLYCTFVTLGQMDLQQKLLNYTYSEYYQYRISVESKSKRSEILSLISSLKQSFSPFVNSGQVQDVKIRVINQFVYQEIYGSMIFFDTMINENTQRVDFYLQTNNISYVFEEQIALQFLKGNLKSQLQLTNQLINQIVTSFFQKIESDQFIYLMFMMIQLLIIFIMIIIQFKFWKDPYIYMQNVLLLISRVPEKDIEILSLKYKSIKEKILQNQNSWKKINYFKDIYNCRISELKKLQQSQKINSITSTQQKKQSTKAKLTSRIQETTFRIWHIYLMLLFLLLLLSGLVISSYMFQYLNTVGSQPELQLCMNFVLFKSDFDSAMILSQLLKNQQILIIETMQSGVFSKNPQLNTTDYYFKDLYNEMVEFFILTKTSAYIAFQQLYDNIVSSTKISSENKILLLGIYQEDLCLYIKETLPFCAYENEKFQYFPDYPPALPIDNNKEKFKYGLNGIVQEIASIFKSYYVQELNGEKDKNLEQVKQFINSAEYNQIILAYYFDINKAIIQFFVTIIDASLDILESNYQQTQIYYVVFGIVTTILLFLTIGWRSITLQKQIRSVRQALVVLPHENLLDPQIYNSIKRFERNM